MVDDMIQQGPKHLSKLLENSFSKAISYHQPWVGSLSDNATIHCDDTGGYPGGMFLQHMMVVVAQLNHIEYGGIAVSICMSHNVSDLRKTIPPSIQSTTTIGNILTAFSTPTYNLEDLRLPKLVFDIRKSKLEFSNKDNFKNNTWILEMLEYTNKVNTGIEDAQSYLQKSSCHDVYRCSSICNMPYQDLDFGWGRPSRASMASAPFNNVLYLMNTHDQSKGIEST
ncbi:hypothetical protein KY290_008716 [Solanum tuberosum]|uniref:Acyltransferase n=1 Tax=Solanum tuberosum TaxID=4113 RepID=A0ABQ7W9M9_SOLTU|nr:hypothetical protein KY290_008716 [Solanum tuberosum]